MLIMNINIKNLALICRYTNQPLSSILQISQMFRGTICEDPFLQHVKYILQKRQTTAKTFYWYETAKDNVHLCGVFLKIDQKTGKALEIERILFPEFDKKQTVKND